MDTTSPTAHPAYEGRCLCGQVSYVATGEPVFQFNCHCDDCRKSTGCAYAPIMFFARAAVKVSGNLTYHAMRGGSGHTIARGFCGGCGAQIVGDADMVGSLLSIRAGTLDDPGLYQPKADVFVSQAAAWDAMDPRLPKYDRWPPRRA
ncbi:GFA family protein [Thermomonas brevis]|uniref:GFA family protein n=1 Tax=Thermomonas brevis TaxID=215691 RepID=A0A7G9QRU1_9GAMM|nr:GFA family protein [Thermomonas brevis]QNN46066.1 GFA family protein [Thermomonas brevis]